MAGYIVMQVSTPLVDTVGAQNKAEVIALVGDIFRGTDAPQLQIQYSTNGASWHTTWVSGDIYLRTSADGGTTWSGAILFVQNISTKAEIVLAEALAAHEADIAGIDVDNLGDAHARNLDLDNLPTLCTFPIKRIETDTPSALSAVPGFVGQEYYDTTNKKKYEAFGTSSVNDWVVIN